MPAWVDSFAVRISQPPVLSAVPDQEVQQGELLSVVVTANDPDGLNGNLEFSLSPGAPAGMSVDPSNGLLTWTPIVGWNLTNRVTVRVSDRQWPELTATASFDVIVQRKILLAPTVDFIPDQTVNEGELLSFTVTAHDSNLPPESLTFSLVPDAPPGSAIDPITGVFTFTPTEAQGPGNYTVRVRATQNGNLPDTEVL